MSHLWTGSINGIKLQVWATWLFYGILIDLAPAIAEESEKAIELEIRYLLESEKAIALTLIK